MNALPTMQLLATRRKHRAFFHHYSNRLENTRRMIADELSNALKDANVHLAEWQVRDIEEAAMRILERGFLAGQQNR